MLWTKNADVFQDKLGCLKGVKAQIHADSDATQISSILSCQICSLRVAYKGRKGINGPPTRRRHHSARAISDWAAPIVPVIKEEGNVRIRGDHKVTIKKVAKIDKYPTPRMDDLFALLSGGKKFSKMDLSHAYQQLELHEEPRPYVTINTQKGLYTYNRPSFGVSSALSIFQHVIYKSSVIVLLTS